MNKKFIILICWIIIVSISFNGCKGFGKNHGTVDEKNIVNTDYNEMSEYKGGLHNFEINKTDKKLIANGICEYKLVYSQSGSEYIKSAVSEFSSLFSEAVGSLIYSVNDNQIVYNENNKYISFGENEYSKASGIKKPEQLKSNGYIIKTIGSSIFILGGEDIGTLFGTYELLTQLFNYMCYSWDCYYIDTNVKEYSLMDYNIIDNPDFEQRLANYGVIYYDKSLAHKLRFELQYDEVYLNPERAFHNTLEYLPPKKYPEHKDYWYSENGKQLCYTAHGNEQEYIAMVDAMVEALKPYIDEDPNKKIITITQEDHNVWCTCEHCKELKNKYGTDSASNIIFINDVAQKIEKWLNKERNGRKIIIATFAYHKSEQAPAQKNSEGIWTAIDNKVKTRDNVAILYAPLVSMSFTDDIDYSDKNRNVKDILSGWEACSSHIAVWNYQTHFDNYFMPYDTYSACQEQYKKYLSLGAQWIFDQGQHNNRNSSNFSMLKLYLNSQWGWDVNRNYNELVNNFFENYYGKKDGALRMMYEEMRTHLKNLQYTNTIETLTSDCADKAVYWNLGLLTQWMDYIDKAYQEIEIYKDNYDKYIKLYEHITLESLTPRYMLLSFYSNYFSQNEKTKMISAFFSDCEKLHITRYKENGLISDLIKTL